MVHGERFTISFTVELLIGLFFVWHYLVYNKTCYLKKLWASMFCRLVADLLPTCCRPVILLLRGSRKSRKREGEYVKHYMGY